MMVFYEVIQIAEKYANQFEQRYHTQACFVDLNETTLKMIQTCGNNTEILLDSDDQRIVRAGNLDKIIMDLGVSHLG